ncbi:MAG: AraC family transcriptional regulator [Clostridia bacterium]|nr:AraC family transcriptional regulator [Clostridia bacterium]
MEWIERINDALQYVEAHLSDSNLSVPEVAKHIHFSHFYLQRMFSMMTDMTLAEYIRQRRLSMAGQELRWGGARVIDVALKYGYDSPESFQKAFRRFHGITPAAAKRSNVQLRYLNPLRLQITLTGGTIMDYSIETLPGLTIIGMERGFRYEDCLQQIPKFWDEYHAKGYSRQCAGYLGVCFDDGAGPDGDFAYLIARFGEPDENPPQGFVKRTVPGHTWAKFRTTGPMPTALQQLNRRIFTEWLPNNPEYELSENMNIEMYTEGDVDSADYVSEIWIPIRKAVRRAE